MGMMDLMFWPFAFLFSGAMFVFGLIAVIFWIWVLVDCARRKFRNNLEKIIWIVVLVFAGIIGALVYLIVIRMSNPSGLAKH
jgi:hypothetical protein